MYMALFILLKINKFKGWCAVCPKKLSKVKKDPPLIQS